MCTRTDTSTFSGTLAQQTPIQTPIQTPVSARAEGVVSGLEQTPIWCSNRPLRELVLERWSRGLLDVLPGEKFRDSDLTSSGRRRPSIDTAWRNCSCLGLGRSVAQLGISTPRRLVMRLLFCRVLAPRCVSAVSARSGAGSIDSRFRDRGSAHRLARSRGDFSKPGAPLVCKGEAYFRGIGPTFGLVRGAPFSRVLQKRSYLWPGEGKGSFGKPGLLEGGCPAGTLCHSRRVPRSAARWRSVAVFDIRVGCAASGLGGVRRRFERSGRRGAAAPPGEFCEMGASCCGVGGHRMSVDRRFRPASASCLARVWWAWFCENRLQEGGCPAGTLCHSRRRLGFALPPAPAAHFSISLDPLPTAGRGLRS